eukprot:Awhi_evm1s8867
MGTGDVGHSQKSVPTNPCFLHHHNLSFKRSIKKKKLCWVVCQVLVNPTLSQNLVHLLPYIHLMKMSSPTIAPTSLNLTNTKISSKSHSSPSVTPEKQKK